LFSSFILSGLVVDRYMPVKMMVQ